MNSRVSRIAKQRSESPHCTVLRHCAFHAISAFVVPRPPPPLPPPTPPAPRSPPMMLYLTASHVDCIVCKTLLQARVLESGSDNGNQLLAIVGLEGQTPPPKSACNPRQQPLRQVHSVGNCNDCKPAALSGGPLKQVVQHLQNCDSSLIAALNDHSAVCRSSCVIYTQPKLYNFDPKAVEMPPISCTELTRYFESFPKAVCLRVGS